MTTSSTTLLGLALPVTGELSGTWGDVINASLTSLLDSAIAGTTTLSSDADVTLTTTTLVANEARQAVLLCTGNRTGIKTITAPARSKVYVVINATTGSPSTYGVKLVGAGPTTGVTIPNGKACLVIWNGSDFVIANSATINLTTDVTGTLPIANGGTNATATPTAGAVPYGTGTAYAFTGAGTSGQVLTSAGAGTPTWTTPTTGTVTSVGLSMPTQFAISNSPVTGSGTLTAAWNNQSVGVVLAGPATGSAAAPTFRALAATDIPTLNQNTTGSAASLSISGQTGLLTFTGLASTNRTKTVRDAADTILELGGSYTPSGTWNWTSATVTWPTFNQNTTGSAGSVTNAVTFNNVGSGDASGTTFNGGAARTISYNTIGAPSATGSGASGTWSININGTVGATTANTGSFTQLKTATSSITGGGTLTPDPSAVNQINYTLNATTTFAAPSGGTISDGQKLIFRIVDDGTARGITWNATYRQIGVTLPATTVLTKTIYVGCIYNAAAPAWDVVAVATQA